MIFVPGFKYRVLKDKPCTKISKFNLPNTEFEDFVTGYIQVDFLDMSFLVSKDFSFRGFDEIEYSWFGAIGTLSAGQLEKGSMFFSNYLSTEDEETLSKIYKAMGFKNKFDFVQAVYTNNWSPILLLYKDLFARLGRSEVAWFDNSRIKGFLFLLHDTPDTMYGIEIYDKKSLELRKVSVLAIFDEEFYNKDIIVKFISSFRFLDKEEQKAEDYYTKGLECLNVSDITGAQFNFFNAYYLDKKNSEYGYMFAKALFDSNNKEILIEEAYKVLKDVIEFNPDFIKAEELLKRIEQGKVLDLPSNEQ